MGTLNEPMGYEEARREVAWTPLRGLVRGALHGLVAAVVFGALLALLAAYVPYMIIPWWLRVPLAFGVACLLFKVVQRGAGMGGWPCTVLALALTGLVLVSNHVVFALQGVPDPSGVDPWWVVPAAMIEHVVSKQGGVLIGWRWCHPYALLTLNLLPLLLGGGFCTALCSRR